MKKNNNNNNKKKNKQTNKQIRTNYNQQAIFSACLLTNHNFLWCFGESSPPKNSFLQLSQNKLNFFTFLLESRSLSFLNSNHNLLQSQLFFFSLYLPFCKPHGKQFMLRCHIVTHITLTLTLHIVTLTLT